MKITELEKALHQQAQHIQLLTILLKGAAIIQQGPQARTIHIDKRAMEQTAEYDINVVDNKTANRWEITLTPRPPR